MMVHPTIIVGEPNMESPPTSSWGIKWSLSSSWLLVHRVKGMHVHTTGMIKSLLGE